MDLSNYIPHPNFYRLEPEQGVAASEKLLSELSCRRTIRIYDKKPVPDKIIENAIKAAATAPSGANQQPWYFAVIKDHELKKKVRQLAEACETEFYDKRANETFKKALEPFGTNDEKQHLEDASHIIAVFTQAKDIKEDGSEDPIYYGIKSTSIAVGMLLTSLHLAGVGTLTHTPSPMNFLNDLLGVSKNYKGQFLIMAGYPKEPILVPAIERKKFNEVCKICD